MSKRRPATKAELLARMPRAFRPKLDAAQVRDLGLVHIVNLDTIVRGEGDFALLMEWVESVFLWSRVAELLQAGVEEMTEQLHLAHAMIQRYDRTGRVGFSGEEYQLAKDGISVMDQLAELTDRPTAVAAANWSEALVAGLADERAQRAQQESAAVERIAA